MQLLHCKHIPTPRLLLLMLLLLSLLLLLAPSPSLSCLFWGKKATKGRGPATLFRLLSLVIVVAIIIITYLCTCSSRLAHWHELL